MGKDAILAFVAVLKAVGLPEPEPEYRFARPRRWRFDLSWPEQRIAFEREGATWTGGRHTTGRGYRNDCEKYSNAAILGWIVIRATADMIRNGTALALVEKAFAARS